MDTLKHLLRQDQITGFSYSFTKLLLDRLNQIFLEGKLYEKNAHGAPCTSTALTGNLCHYLEQQIPEVKWLDVTSIGFNNDDKSVWKEDGPQMMEKHNLQVKKVIDDAYDFLLTFEVKVGKEEQEVPVLVETSIIPQSAKDALLMTIEEMAENLPVGVKTRVKLCLMSGKINIVAQAVWYTRDELLKFRNYGKKCHDAVEVFYTQVGIDTEILQSKMAVFFPKINAKKMSDIPNLVESEEFKELIELSAPYQSRLANLAEECVSFNIEHYSYTLCEAFPRGDGRRGSVGAFCEHIKRVAESFVVNELKKFLATI